MSIEYNYDGYINESFEHLIDRLPIPRILGHIRNINRELKNGVSEDRKKILNERLEYCLEKIKGVEINVQT